MHSRNPRVIELAGILGRTSSAVAMKLVNFASFDSALQARGVSGMSNTSRLDRLIWDEFNNNWEELIFESERMLIDKQNELQSESLSVANFSEIVPEYKEGTDRLQQVRLRINQGFFRKMILALYNNQCVISRSTHPELLVASHIIPWAGNAKTRMDPRNSLCLSALYDRAYDRGLLSINKYYTILISADLKKHEKDPYFQSQFGQFEGRLILLPERFLPAKEYLKYHLNYCFRS
jgi:putative restriction endonuclease